MFRLTVSDVFFIRGRGTVVTGRVEQGTVRVGDQVRINDSNSVRVDGIEAFRKTLAEANAGDNIGLLFSGLDQREVEQDDVITGVDDDAGAAAPTQAASAPAAPPQAPEPPPPPSPPATDPRFAAVEAQRTQYLSMRDAGVISDAQVDESLNALIVMAGGREWKLTAASDQWYSLAGGEWKPDTPRA